MIVSITGASGFVGRLLSSRLHENGFKINCIDMASPINCPDKPGIRYIQADTTCPGEWQTHISDADAVVNLAGRNIFGLWTPSCRKEIYESRILTTRNLVQALKKGSVLINASAVGFYGDRGDDPLCEEEACGNDFLAGVCKDWEYEAEAASTNAERLVILRFGIIIGKNGGALKNMLPAYRMGLGGPLGTGKQWFPWIHSDDILDIINLAIKSDMAGIYNACSPGLITQAELSEAIAKTVGMPDFFRIPKILVTALLGDFGKAITSSQKALSKKLVESGFEFKYKNIIEALSDSV